MKTITLNPSLALVLYKEADGSCNARCFVADFDQELDPQASDYLLYKDIDPARMIQAWWDTMPHDRYGNLYSSKVEQIRL